jgi:polysaccharide biosynthesis/export protein
MNGLLRSFTGPDRTQKAFLGAPLCLQPVWMTSGAMGTANFIAPGGFVRRQMFLCKYFALLISAGLLCLPQNLNGATTALGPGENRQQVAPDQQSATKNQGEATSTLETANDWNRRLKELLVSNPSSPGVSGQEYRIGPEDLLNITVFEAPELNREVRVSASGEFSLPLLGSVQAAGLTPRELEFLIQGLLQRTYMKDPHVSVFVRDVQSHPVTVMGAVRRPGVFQIRGSKSLLEVLSLAEGLADDAGETVIILRGPPMPEEQVSPPGHSSLADLPAAGPQIEEPKSTVSSSSSSDGNQSAHDHAMQVNLKHLLESADPRNDPLVNPGDIVKVSRAGVVYVVGEVRRPGGFALKSNEKISVLQALALSEGLTNTAAKSEARIIRTDQHSGEQLKTPINLGKIMAGKAPDPLLEPKDILLVPNSVAKSTLNHGVETATQTLAGLLIFHW